MTQARESKKYRIHCSNGHVFEWENDGFGPTVIQVEGVSFCAKCIRDKMQGMDIGEIEFPGEEIPA